MRKAKKWKYRRPADYDTMENIKELWKNQIPEPPAADRHRWVRHVDVYGTRYTLDLTKFNCGGWALAVYRGDSLELVQGSGETAKEAVYRTLKDATEEVVRAIEGAME